MKLSKIKIGLMSLLFFIQFSAQAQKEEMTDKPKCFPYRIGIKTLIPNILGGTVEYVLPVANNRFSAVADYTRFGLPRFVSEALDFDATVRASISYLAIGANVYLNKKQRGGGPYLGARYQQFTAKSSIESDESFNAKGTQKAAALLFGISSAGHFWAGLEVGAGMPLGNATGSYVEVVNGKSTRTVYSEKLISVIPIFNFKMGAAF